MQTKPFRVLLPLVQCFLAALCGGAGLWQRSAILSRRFFGEQTLWDSTARFHVWPWPFKFAVIENLPAFHASALFSWPIGAWKPDMSEGVQLAPSLLFVLVFWYWIGSQLDRRRKGRTKAAWCALVIFTVVCLIGALVPIGSTGYLPYAFLVWLIGAISFRRLTKSPCVPGKLIS